ncbi:MAG: PTS sugar transporter subunit IIB [Streptococcaceae bacterium]|jgi:PTS system cellobiose-specific IIB component|nr:PTS sugar transporter subunit IIB [Streptococcaceae bacterium]
MDKKQIVLFCSAGMSTSLLVRKMEEEAKELGENVEIKAFPVSDISSQGGDADIILLGPQIRYMEEKVGEEFPTAKVQVIDIRDYGMLDGKSVFHHAIED